MTILRVGFLLALLYVVSGVPARTLRGPKQAPLAPAASGPVLRNTCLITGNVSQLVEFYEKVLAMPAETSGKDYAEFRTGAGVLAIFSAEAQEKYILHAAEPGTNRSAILEFEVPAVDQEYARLQGIVKNWVKPPTTQPWGTRSFYFRDPDGNLINFFMWVKPHP